MTTDVKIDAETQAYIDSGLLIPKDDIMMEDEVITEQAEDLYDDDLIDVTTVS